MAEQPNRVVLYSFADGAPGEVVAEFRWDDERGVTLTVMKEEEAEIARQYVERGAPDDHQRRSVPVGEGPAFMRALTSGTRSTYLRFVDESS